MTQVISPPLKSDRYIHLILNPQRRFSVWEKARGMWKNRKPDPIKELKNMRKGWERKLPRLK